MARLESQRKMGYYPTPPKTLREIKRLLRFPHRETIHVLDPCCGKGEVLQEITMASSDTITYGVELNEERGQIAMETLSYFAYGSTFDLIVEPSESMGLLWLNPPYDSANGRRMDLDFLRHSLQWLSPGGILVFIVPEKILDTQKVRKWIASWFDKVSVYRIHRDEFPVFKQVVLFGVKRSRQNPSAEAFSLSTLHVEEARMPYLIPSTTGANRFFCDRNRIRTENTKKRVRELLTESDDLSNTVLNPIFPLRKGHLVSLIAAGCVDGKIENEDGTFILVKGYTERTEKTVEDYDRKEIRTIHSTNTGIRVIDPFEGTVYDIK